MSDTPPFGTWLKRCRQARGLTQDTLAEQVGCATQTIRKIEGGQRRPSYQMAVRMAQVLDLAPAERAAWIRAARETAEPEAAPPLETLRPAAPPPSLPAYFTPFIGREQERADLARLLARPSCRLVTLLGPGGIGKTRLAVEVARQITGFPDGVTFVPLAPVAAASAIVPSISDALGFSFSGTTDLVTQLLGHLHDKRALLVLDNLEHLLDPEGATLGLLGQFMAQAPNITLLATSRERLKLPGEWVLEIAGLAVPPADLAQPPAAAYPALTLFVEHAQRVQHSFRLEPQNERAVATICRMVGGMPLGIELAAAWVRMLSPDEIGHELTRDLNAQHLAHGTMPARHHSLRSVVDHSWHLLMGAEREVLRRLAVFQGGFSRTAAAEIAEANLAVLASLADKSLLRRAPGGRYHLHEIIRQYAAARLDEDQAARDTTHDRHADYYTIWLAARRRPLLGAQQAASITEIVAEIDNIRAAWLWATTHRRLDDLQRAAETLHWFYEFRGWYAEGAAVFEQAVAALGALPPEPADHAHRKVLGQLLGHYAYLASRIGRLAQAVAAAAQSRALLETSDDGVALTHTYVYQVMTAFQVGDYGLARSALAHALARATPDDTWSMALAETWGCLLAHALGDNAEAERLFRTGLAHYRSLGNPRGLVFCLSFGSITLLASGKLEEAQTLLRESLMLASIDNDRFGMAMTMQHLGLVALEQQDAAEAVYLFREALELMRATGSRWDMARVLNQFGAALWLAGASAEAGKTYREALAMALEAQATPDALQALAGLAAQLHHAGRPAAALAFAARILADPASRIETRDQAEHIRAALIRQLPAEQIAAIERQARDQPLAALVQAMRTGG